MVIVMNLYEDHVEQIEMLDEPDKNKLIWVLIHYSMDRTAPTEQELAEMHPLMRALWAIMKKDVDNYDKKRENGRKGGRPKADKTMVEPKQNIPETIVKPTLNHGLTYPEPTQNVSQTNININRNINTNENIVSSNEETITTNMRGQSFEQFQNPSSSSIPNIFPIINPKESPFVANPPDVETVFQWGQVNVGSDFTREEAQAFVSYYDGVGWVSGRNQTPIRKWQSYVKPWHERQREFEKKQQQGVETGEVNFDEIVERAFERNRQIAESRFQSA